MKCNIMRYFISDYEGRIQDFLIAVQIYKGGSICNFYLIIY